MKNIKQKGAAIKQRNPDVSGRTLKTRNHQMFQKRAVPVAAAKKTVEKTNREEDIQGNSEVADPVQDANQTVEQETISSADRTADWAVNQAAKIKHHVHDSRQSSEVKRPTTILNKEADSSERPLYGRTNTTSKSQVSAKHSGRTIKPSRYTVKTAQKSRRAIKKSRISVKTARATSRKMLKTLRSTIRTSVRTVKTTVKLVIAAAKGTVAAIKSLGALITAGGWIAVLIILIVVIIGWLLTSPYALFWADTDDPRSLPIVMAELRQETADYIEQIKRDHEDVNDVHIIYEGSEDGAMVRNEADILAVYAVRISMDASNPDDLITLDTRKEDILRETYQQMVQIRFVVKDLELDEEHIDNPGSHSGTDTDEDDSISVLIPSAERLIIYINCRSYDEVISTFSLFPEQVSMLQELIQPEFQAYFMSLAGILQPDPISAEQIRQIRKSLPADLTIRQTQVAEAALSLVGKVGYFWGGKSTTIGWDERWGILTKVTAPGSATTDTVRPFGLDCSGYAAWVYVNAGIPADMIKKVFGTHTSTQWQYSAPVSWDMAQIGDLSFYAVPGTTKNNHVGIIIGIDHSGNHLIAHCSSSQNGVVVDLAGDTGFRYIRSTICMVND